MNGFSQPASSQWAAGLLAAHRAGTRPKLMWSAAEPLRCAGEWERRDLVRGIAGEIASLQASAAGDPGDLEICLRLLDHLSRSPGRGALGPL